MRLADRIKIAREQAGLTQTELARLCGIAQPSLHDLESGKSKSPRGHTLLKMAKALGRSPEWLAGAENQPSDSEPLTRDERALLEFFRKLSTAERRMALRVLRALGEPDQL